MKPLTDAEKVFCENWMGSYARLTQHLTDKQFTEPVLLKMIWYEMGTRQRKTVLDRLFARYFRLRKDNTIGAATRWMKSHDKPDLFIQSIVLTNQKEPAWETNNGD